VLLKLPGEASIWPDGRAAARARRVAAQQSPSDFLSDRGGEDGGSAGGGIFVARDDPRQFFVRAPLPGTSAAPSPSPAPERAASHDARASSGHEENGGGMGVRGGGRGGGGDRSGGGGGGAAGEGSQRDGGGGEERAREDAGQRKDKGERSRGDEEGRGGEDEREAGGDTADDATGGRGGGRAPADGPVSDEQVRCRATHGPRVGHVSNPVRLCSSAYALPLVLSHGGPRQCTPPA
jgi:hypothetical protein